jgi:hypothetical protein
MARLQGDSVEGQRLNVENSFDSLTIDLRPKAKRGLDSAGQR